MVVGGVEVRTVENWHPGVLRRCSRNERGRNKPHLRTAQLLLCWQAEKKREKRERKAPSGRALLVLCFVPI